VSRTDQSGATSTRISPPGICTVTGLAQRPVRMAAPAAAQDDVPEASVYAAPRSQISMRSVCGSTTWAYWTLVRFG